MLRKNPLPIDDNVNGYRLFLTEAAVNSIDVYLPKNVDGEDHENVLYIAGFTEEAYSIGCTVIAPEAETGWGHYRTPSTSHSQVVDFLADHRLKMVAQVHCHPGSETYHSDGDDELAFVHAEGYWSLVVPHYGYSGFRPIADAGVHCYSNGRFRLLSPKAAEHRLLILPDYIDLRGRDI